MAKQYHMKEIFNRVNQYLFFFVLLIVVMFFGKAFLVPVVFAALLAMLMAPVCRRFEGWGLNRPFSTIGCILILLLVIGGIGFIVSTQISTFADNLSQIESKGEELLQHAQAWIEEQIGMSPKEQEEVVKKEAEKSSQQGPSLAGFCSLRYRETPMIVPVVPMADTKWVIVPCVSRHISGPVV